MKKQKKCRIPYKEKPELPLALGIRFKLWIFCISVAIKAKYCPDFNWLHLFLISDFLTHANTEKVE